MESASAWLRNEFSLGTDSFVITNTKAEEMAANALAHEIWHEYRVAWLQGYLKTQKQHHRISNDLYYQRLRRAKEESPVLGVEFAGSTLDLHMGDLVAIRHSVKVDMGSSAERTARALIDGAVFVRARNGLAMAVLG